MEKNNSDYVLEHLKSFHVPLIRNLNGGFQGIEIVREIDSIIKSLESLKEKVNVSISEINQKQIK